MDYCKTYVENYSPMDIKLTTTRGHFPEITLTEENFLEAAGTVLPKM